MVTLDHTRYDVVGIVTQMGLSQNAQIKGIGLSDRETGEFIPVLPVDRNRVFPTRGNVFAYDFLKHNPGWENECVCLCVKPNNNQNIVNGEDYVWDWKDAPYIFADRIKNLKTPLSEDGGFNNELLRKEGILPCEEVTYFMSGDNIYRLDPGARLLPFWKVSDVSSSLLICNGLTYLFNDLQENEAGKLDLTSDEQVIEWYKKNILRKEWGTIYEAKDFKAVDSLVTAELQRLRVPSNVYNSRLSRILTLSANISMTFEELEDIATAPWFKDTILDTMDRFAELYIEKVKKEHEDEITKINNKHEKRLNDLDTQFRLDIELLRVQKEDKMKELKELEDKIKSEEERLGKKAESLREEVSALEESVQEKSKALESLDSRKESIIADFSVIKEVLACGTSTKGPEPEDSITINEFNQKNERDFPTAGPYKKNIDSLLMKYKAGKVSADEIVTMLATHNVVLFPDSETLLATMQATRRCRYVVSYVGVGWKSFDDLRYSGLSAIVAEAIKNPDMIHFLVLRNINMSYIPCYLQPVLDMQSGLSQYFPGTGIGFPENLRILCTRTKDTVIPVSASSLEGIGCITPSEEKHSGTGSIAEGYLPVSVFSDLPVDELYEDTDAKNSYIDE